MRLPLFPEPISPTCTIPVSRLTGTCMRVYRWFQIWLAMATGQKVLSLDSWLLKTCDTWPKRKGFTFAREISGASMRSTTVTERAPYPILTTRHLSISANLPRVKKTL
ncbi:hypothetical protein ES708_33028 [subsurface metagenome]